MDSELFTQILSLVTLAWTALQEYRHRKVTKAGRPSEVLQAKPKGKQS